MQNTLNTLELSIALNYYFSEMGVVPDIACNQLGQNCYLGPFPSLSSYMHINPMRMEAGICNGNLILIDINDPTGERLFNAFNSRMDRGPLIQTTYNNSPWNAYVYEARSDYKEWKPVHVRDALGNKQAFVQLCLPELTGTDHIRSGGHPVITNSNIVQHIKFYNNGEWPTFK